MQALPKTEDTVQKPLSREALYALSRVNGENPVVMTPQLVTLSPRKMWAHLLCRELLTRGIWFDVFTDTRAKNLAGLCCVQSGRKVLHLTNCHQRFVEAGRHI